MTTKVMFMPNGLTVAFENGQQSSDLQQPWFELYLHALASLEVDVTGIEFTMPDASRVRVVNLPDGGFNWSTG